MSVGLLATVRLALDAGAALGDSVPHSSSDPESARLILSEEGTGSAESEEARASGVKVEVEPKTWPALGVAEAAVLGVTLPCC